MDFLIGRIGTYLGRKNLEDGKLYNALLKYIVHKKKKNNKMNYFIFTYEK